MKFFLQISVIIKGLSSFTQEICLSLARKKKSKQLHFAFVIYFFWELEWKILIKHTKKFNILN